MKKLAMCIAVVCIGLVVLAGCAEKTIPDTYITMAEYQEIEMGMTYEEVCEIIGSEGELGSAVDFGAGSEYVTEMYTWYSVSGGAASITFQGGKVVMITQVGI